METCALHKFYNEVLGSYCNQHYTLVFYSILKSRKVNSYQNTYQNIQNPLCGVNQPHCPADAFQTRRSIELTTIKNVIRKAGVGGWMDTSYTATTSRAPKVLTVEMGTPPRLEFLYRTYSQYKLESNWVLKDLQTRSGAE